MSSAITSPSTSMTPLVIILARMITTVSRVSSGMDHHRSIGVVASSGMPRVSWAGASILSLRKRLTSLVRWRVQGEVSLFARLGAREGSPSGLERIHQGSELAGALHREHRCESRWWFSTQDVGG